MSNFLAVLKRGSAAALLSLGAISGAQAMSFDIVVSFTGGITPSQQAAFTAAENTWEGFFSGYAAGVSITGIDIDASAQAIDGAGGILGQAGPTMFVTQGGFALATDGIMQFDSADLAQLEGNGTLLEVILHEMAHVMGLGTLWNLNSVYVNGTGQYTGANGVAAYQNEYDAGSAFVPVELDGLPGTADGHWDELLVTDGMGRTLSSELMTGFLNSPTYISETTLEQFVDLGFVRAVAAAPIPVPATAGLLMCGLLLLRRRRNAA